MKLFLQIIYILVIFFKTGNLLSDNNIFNVNNILIEKKDNISSKQLADLAIKEAFRELTKKILLNEDIPKISNLNFSDIKNLVAYYNVANETVEKKDKLNFNVKFDRDKIHDLFYKKNISYTDIIDKEFYILPILLKDSETFIFSNNYFYKYWNANNRNEVIEFILPIENIEIIQKINQSGDYLLDLDLKNIFEEYTDKNIGLIIIENNSPNIIKVFFKLRIQNKILSKNYSFKNNNLEEIIFALRDEITNLVKSQNLIDIRVPSFLNVKLNLDQKSNLVILNSKMKKIDLIENVLVTEFNKNYVDLKIKYLGKFEVLINQLKKQNINLKFINEHWFLKIL